VSLNTDWTFHCIWYFRASFGDQIWLLHW